MSKITFRADDDLVERVEQLDASKSEVMRDALRSYLGGREPTGPDHVPGPSGREGRAGTEQSGQGATDPADLPLDDLVAERLDAMLAERLDATLPGGDLNLTVSLEGVETVDASGRPPAPAASDGAAAETDAPEDAGEHAPRDECAQCGTDLDDEHVYCPNCGEKAGRRVFCECGDELRSDWAFCPRCGRRTPAADVLE